MLNRPTHPMCKNGVRLRFVADIPFFSYCSFIICGGFVWHVTRTAQRVRLSAPLLDHSLGSNEVLATHRGLKLRNRFDGSGAVKIDSVAQERLEEAFPADARPATITGFNSNSRINRCRLFTWMPSTRAASL
jgi:hypothetical protein